MSERDRHPAGEDRIRRLEEELARQHEELTESRAVLEESRSRYEDLYEFAPFPYLTLDGYGVVLDANLTTVAFLAVDRRSLVGAPLLPRVEEGHRGLFLDHMLRCRRNRGEVRTELRLRSEEGDVPVELLSRPTRSWAKRTLVFRTAIRDLTEQYRAEEARRVLALEKERAESAREARDRFIATISHEMRTPLTPVLACLDALEAEDLSESVRSKLGMIRRNIRDEVRLIDDLLDMTRLLRDRLPLLFRVVEIDKVLARVVEDLSLACSRAEVELAFVADASRHAVWGDGQRLRQVFLNLLQNAVKATPPGGAVTIRTKNRGNGLVVEVVDTGRGMTREEIEAVFQPFHQIGRGGGGLGLGLSIARGLVETMRGSIRAESEGPGRGCRFVVELPVAAATRTRPTPTEAPSPAGEADAEPCRILYVEDHPDTGEAMRMLLEMEGFAVRLAQSCEEARTLMETGADAIDLLISDLALPDGSGLDVLRACRVRRPGLPAIAITGFGADEALERTREAGFSAHLVKPVSLPGLLAAIRRATE